MTMFAKYKHAFILGIQNAMEYRLDFILGLLSSVFPIMIQIFMWTAIFNSTGGNHVYGYSYTQLILYTLLASIVTRLVGTGFEYEINSDIKNGDLNKYIVKPINYFTYRLSCFMGTKIFSSVILFTIIAIICFVVNHLFGFSTQVDRVFLFVLAVFFAIFLNFLIYFCMGMLAFWLSEVSLLFGTINIIFIIISGGIFPLDIFGETFIRVVNVLPFKYTIQFPVNILNEKLNIANAFSGLLTQCIWIVLMLLLAIKLWEAGRKKYIAVGG